MAATWLAFISTFGLLLAVELPDKTLVATLVLTTRFPAAPVFLGVCVAFAIQSIVAVLFGSVLTVLPGTVVSLAAALLFALGAFLLLREGFSPDEAGEQDASRSGPNPVSFIRSAVTSFGVLFAAEWGDASQLATAALAAHYGNPWAVGAGAFLALTSVAGVAIFVGHKIRSRIRPKLIQRIAGCVFAIFAAIALWQTLF